LRFLQLPFFAEVKAVGTDAESANIRPIGVHGYVEGGFRREKNEK